jgi:membrane associated rhomboid family serine protease
MTAFLHGSFKHIAGNVSIQLYLGSGIEYGIGPLRMAFLYLTSQIGGVLLAMTVHPEWYGVGASCAGFGLIGFLLAYVFSNWSYMSRVNKYQKWYLFGISIFFFILNMGLHFR